MKKRQFVFTIFALLLCFPAASQTTTKTLEFSDGKYTGEVLNNKPHGRGKYVWKWGDVSIYEGYYKDGQRNGLGMVTFRSGDIYVGNFVDDYRDGEGVMFWKHGDYYYGQYVHGKHEGKGSYYYSTGDKYEGEFLQDISVGHGVYYYANGNKFVGENFRRDHGYGTFVYITSGIYIGEVSDRKRNGVGTMIYSDGRKYVGEWVFDVKEGFGTMTYNDGRIESGKWKQNKFIKKKKDVQFNDTISSTFCSFSYNGSQYEGWALNGKPHGQGSLTFGDGAKYTGEWDNGIIEGQGIYVYADGSKYIGEWKNGKKNGYGTMIYSNGDIYIGDLKDGIYHGFGRLSIAKGGAKVGEWSNGKLVYSGIPEIFRAKDKELIMQKNSNIAIQKINKTWSFFKSKNIVKAINGTYSRQYYDKYTSTNSFANVKAYFVLCGESEASITEIYVVPIEREDIEINKPFILSDVVQLYDNEYALKFGNECSELETRSTDNVTTKTLLDFLSSRSNKTSVKVLDQRAEVAAKTKKQREEWERQREEEARLRLQQRYTDPSWTRGLWLSHTDPYTVLSRNPIQQYLLEIGSSTITIQAMVNNSWKIVCSNIGYSIRNGNIVMNDGRIIEIDYERANVIYDRRLFYRP